MMRFNFTINHHTIYQLEINIYIYACIHLRSQQCILYLFVQMAYPLCKLPGVGDGGRQKHIVNVVRKKNDSLLPNYSSLWGNKKIVYLLGWGIYLEKKVKYSTRMGFEPTRAEHNGLAVHHLNHSATLSYMLKYHYNQEYWLPCRGKS